MAIATGKKIRLLDGLSADGSGNTHVINIKGECDIEISGTFGGGTATIERLSQDNTTWIAVRDLTRSIVSVSQNEIIPVVFPYGVSIRITLVSSTAPNLDAWLTRVGPNL